MDTANAIEFNGRLEPRHGHVVPRQDGMKARCGGPHLCPVCAEEQRRLSTHGADRLGLTTKGGSYRG